MGGNLLACYHKVYVKPVICRAMLVAGFKIISELEC